MARGKKRRKKRRASKIASPGRDFPQKKEEKKDRPQKKKIFLFAIPFLFVFVLLSAYFVLKNKQKKSIASDELIDDEGKYSLKGLTDRQRDIVKLLISVKRPLTQVDIQKELQMPKAAVSRNVHSLELKGLIEIEKVGMSNLLRLKKP